VKTSGRVVGVSPGVVSVSVDGNATEAVAACCTVPSVVLEAKNPRGLAFQPGDTVEMSDGLGTMAAGTSSFLVLPAVFYGLGTAVLNQWWTGALGAVAGLLLAVLFFKSLRIDQYPRVLGRVGLAVEEAIDKESL
jgi:hypothetical protein